ncbi:MAG: radical SAM protein [Desulfovibrionaceae bacterium]|nr:radical SAM protein [Desulfovibrionaceae bacterium]
MTTFIMQNADGRKTALDYDPRANVLSENGMPLSLPKGVIDEKFATKRWRCSDGAALRVALGKKCNFGCAYCHQKITTDAERAEGMISRAVLDRFIEGCKIAHARYHFREIQFWGGEPLVYFREIAYLHRRFVEAFGDDLFFYIPTNGALLYGERLDWILEHAPFVGISWDGPGQFVRGKNVFAESPSREGILRLFRERPDTTSITPVIHRHSRGIPDVLEEARRLLGMEVRNITESRLVVVSDPATRELAYPEEALPEYGKRLFRDLMTGRVPMYSFFMQDAYVFLYNLGNAPKLGVEFACFFKDEKIVTMDLDGNLLPCQNFTAKSVDFEGHPHRLGNVFDSLERRFPPCEAFQRKVRERCADCPVVTLCRGGCPFFNPAYAAYNCRANYCQKMAVIGYALYLLTGDILKEVIPA